MSANIWRQEFFFFFLGILKFKFVKIQLKFSKRSIFNLFFVEKKSLEELQFDRKNVNPKKKAFHFSYTLFMFLFRSQDNIFTKYNKQHKANTIICIFHTKPNKMLLTENSHDITSARNQIRKTPPLFLEFCLQES